jgi:hypothetical protein
MSIEFSMADENRAVLIRIEGHVSEPEIERMRARSSALALESNCSSFIMDISGLELIEKGDALAVYELGEKFQRSGFPYTTRTAVIMPVNPVAREQVEFLHTVEINRGRGVMRYVDDIDQALEWFRSAQDDIE